LKRGRWVQLKNTSGRAGYMLLQEQAIGIVAPRGVRGWLAMMGARQVVTKTRKDAAAFFVSGLVPARARELPRDKLEQPSEGPRRRPRKRKRKRKAA
jgi:hypothetical protein